VLQFRLISAFLFCLSYHLFPSTVSYLHPGRALKPRPNFFPRISMYGSPATTKNSLAFIVRSLLPQEHELSPFRGSTRIGTRQIPLPPHAEKIAQSELFSPSPGGGRGDVPGFSTKKSLVVCWYLCTTRHAFMFGSAYSFIDAERLNQSLPLVFQALTPFRSGMRIIKTGSSLILSPLPALIFLNPRTRPPFFSIQIRPV